MANKILIFIQLIILISCNGKAQEVIIFEDEKTELSGLKQDGKIIVKPIYIGIDEFTDCGIAGVIHPTAGYFYINKKGEKLDVPYMEIEYQTDRFREGYARFKKDEKLGFIDECGEVVINAKFESVTPFKNGMAIVRKDFEIIEKGPYKIRKGGKYGAIDKNGTLVIPYKFDFISEFSDNKTANAKIDNNDVIINSKGEIVK